MGLGDDQLVDVEVVIVLGISDRRLQALAHVLGDALARKLEVGERARDLLAADHLRDKIELLRTDPDHPAHRFGLVIREASLVCALAHDVSLDSLTRRRRRGRRRVKESRETSWARAHTSEASRITRPKR